MSRWNAMLDIATRAIAERPNQGNPTFRPVRLEDKAKHVQTKHRADAAAALRALVAAGLIDVELPDSLIA